MTEAHTTRRAQHMEKYVEIRPVVIQDWPDAQNVFLKVTNQQFCVTSSLVLPVQRRAHEAHRQGHGRTGAVNW